MRSAGVRDGLRALVHRGLRAGGVERRAEPGGGGGTHRRRKADRVGNILAMALFQPRGGRTCTGIGQTMVSHAAAPPAGAGLVVTRTAIFCHTDSTESTDISRAGGRFFYEHESHKFF